MPITPDTLAVQSFCFRHFKDPAEVAGMVQAIGLSAIELCAVHADAGDPEAFAAVLAPFREAGITVPSLGVEQIRDEAGARNRFESLARTDGSVMEVNFPIAQATECVRWLDALTETHGARAAIHNHGGHHALGNAQTLEWIFSLASGRVGLCLDTAWALDAGHDPVAMAEQFGDRLFSVHVKDFVFGRDRRPEDVVIGTGNLDLEGLIGALRKTGFSGPLVLEYEGDIEDPVPALATCVERLKPLLG